MTSSSEYILIDFCKLKEGNNGQVLIFMQGKLSLFCIFAVKIVLLTSKSFN